MRRVRPRARRLRSCANWFKYDTLALGLVDATVLACAERLNADAIATLDLRHFGVVRLKTSPLLSPRDG